MRTGRMDSVPAPWLWPIPARLASPKECGDPRHGLGQEIRGLGRPQAWGQELKAAQWGEDGQSEVSMRPLCWRHSVRAAREGEMAASGPEASLLPLRYWTKLNEIQEPSSQ